VHIETDFGTYDCFMELFKAPAALLQDWELTTPTSIAFESDFGTYDCFMELFKAPAALLQGLRDELFAHIVGLLKRERRPDLIRMLARLCTDSGGGPVRANQDRVLKFVFEQAPQLLCQVRHSLPTLVKDAFTADMHVCDRITKRPEVSALRLQEDFGDRITTAESFDEEVKLFQYYLSTMELMIAAVKGRNWRTSAHFMEQAVELACAYNDLLFLIKHERMPYELRALACEFMGALYVDRAPFTEVEAMPLVRVWSKLYETVLDEPMK
ncbi:hypothetical protein T484DRAFT_1766381, partial [Baffinella frigidus]